MSIFLQLQSVFLIRILYINIENIIYISMIMLFFHRIHDYQLNTVQVQNSKWGNGFCQQL